MKNLFQLFFILILSTLILSCSSSKTKQIEMSILYSTIVKNTNSGIQEPTFKVIKNEKELETYWNSIHSIHSEITALPKVDFSKETIILVALGTKNNSGFQLKIDQISSLKDKFVLRYTELTPNPKCNYLQVMVNPFELISISKTDKPIEFKGSSSLGECK